VLDSGGLLGADSVRLETEARLESYPLLAATRADFLRRLGRFEEAIDAYRRALGNTRNEPERRYLEGRVAQCKTALE
jgi:RNA polymerase sigma-70 factor (ECF subfamily)